MDEIHLVVTIQLHSNYWAANFHVVFSVYWSFTDPAQDWFSVYWSSSVFTDRLLILS